MLPTYLKYSFFIGILSLGEWFTLGGWDIHTLQGGGQTVPGQGQVRICRRQVPVSKFCIAFVHLYLCTCMVRTVALCTFNTLLEVKISYDPVCPSVGRLLA